MENKVFLELEAHHTDLENLPKHYQRPNGIYIDYSKEFDTTFITIVEENPIDSYGATWQQEQYCAMLNDAELKKLIRILQEIKVPQVKKVIDSSSKVS